MVSSPDALLSRYNLAQLQACLYRSQRMTVDAAGDFAAIIRRAKLARLLVEARRVASEKYRIDLSGPASVLRETRRYGVNFARFVAALPACRDWEMRADIVTPCNTCAKLHVTSQDGYRSQVVAPPPFDSGIEEALAKTWGDSRAGWRLLRDVGIVGFWTPEYLAAKRETLAVFSSHRIVLAISKRIAKLDAAGPGLVIYKTRINPENVV